MYCNLKELLTGNCLSDFTDHVNMVYGGRITFDEFNKNIDVLKIEIVMEFFDYHDLFINVNAEDWNLDREDRFIIQLKKVNQLYNENRNNNLQH